MTRLTSALPTRESGHHLTPTRVVHNADHNQRVVKFESLDPEIRGVLGKKVSELGLKVEGSPVEGYVRELYKEIERRGLKKFRPVCYLTDEWGCPDQQPVLGIPFYLADAKLRKLEKAVDALESERQIMMYMSHEAGHVFNYAYLLYTTPEWRRLFGPFFRPYRDDYRPVPFSRNYVRHIEGWYAQKHPDEDFAETFAVWLTPRSAWRRKYKGWPAMQKLRYVERVARAVADLDPIVNTGEVDITPEDIDVSVEQFYRQAEEVRRPIVRGLIDAICRNCQRMKLWGEVGEEARYLVEITALATTLAMNFLTSGRFE